MRKEKERKGKERKLNRWGWDMILNMKKAEVSIEYCFVSLDFYKWAREKTGRGIAKSLEPKEDSRGRRPSLEEEKLPSPFSRLFSSLSIAPGNKTTGKTSPVGGGGVVVGGGGVVVVVVGSRPLPALFVHICVVPHNRLSSSHLSAPPRDVTAWLG